jgi:hypothetical protein
MSQELGAYNKFSTPAQTIQWLHNPIVSASSIFQLNEEPNRTKNLV